MSASAQNRLLLQQLMLTTSAGHSLRHCRSFSTTLQRYRKPNIQRPRVPGTERRILDAVTVPVFPPDLRPLPEQCYDNWKQKQESRRSEIMDAFNAFRLREATEVFSRHEMVAICHILPSTTREFLVLRAKVVTAGLKLVFIKNDLARKAVENTKWCNLEPYFTSSTAYVVSEQSKVPELIKLLKKTPELQLLGGLVEGRILSREVMLNVAKLPPLDTLRGELCTILSASASKTSRFLTRHQQDLSTNLTQLVAQGSGGAEGDVGSEGIMGSGDTKESSSETVESKDKETVT
ncbi:39S ribosomal protein L10, mitochondrial [Aplysia californica]|uniref:Large ribosomal subunit protein uL10m n=1 Tax=Aplysia californica TaxID=6500 RepID=A0ABM0JIQ0_APLCA|nr:39S ribosomal protein L10, mitochondrial [Aplysia californica]XP_005094553.1 39S ribosomal protein L10, mitochondrial [Aplysia californica]